MLDPVSSEHTIHNLENIRIVNAEAHRLQHSEIDSYTNSDFKQHFWCRLAEKQAGFDSKRGKPGAYATVVCRSARTDLLRHAHALKRTPPWPLISLSELPPSAEPAYDPRLHPASFWHDSAEARDRQIDMRAMIESLPPAERSVADHVLIHGLEGAARQRGISVKAMREIVQNLRRHVSPDLADYIE